ncbi:hypothetical protein L7F22_006654 [Adiantum nelumboides]|nr:hypothetical protein [Adiantum nelumboides]
MVGGSAAVESSVEISSASTSLGRTAAETRNVQPPLKAVGQTTPGCSSCFGRVITNSRRLPSQESITSGHGLRYRKSRRCLRKLSCISSCDVLPTVTSSPSISLDKHGTARSIKHRGESLNGLRNGKAALISSAGSLVHKNLRRGLGGFLREKGAATTTNQSTTRLRSDLDSSFRTGNWCLMRPTLVKSDTMMSSSTLSRVNSALQIPSSGRSRAERDASRSSTDSCETSFISVSNEETLSRRLVGNLEGSSFYDRDSNAMDSGERRNTTGLWFNSGLSSSTPRSLGTRDRAISSSSVFSGTSSTSRTTRVPFLFGMAHRTRSLEVISSPSSYMSSPDVHLSNPDMLRSYTSTLQSPYLSRAASSPEYQEGYPLHSSSDTSVFRSFRQFPLQPFEEGQECFTYGGMSEQQVFMWEANLILGGIPVQDQYRDLRLDIDSMSYEDLLALEESIGNVCTGLEKDTISSCLRSKKYSVNDDLISTPEIGELKCSICQVDFEEGNELGTLKCGHNHHFPCIEEWLLRKNQCPICKASAFTKTET